MRENLMTDAPFAKTPSGLWRKASTKSALLRMRAREPAKGSPRTQPPHHWTLTREEQRQIHDAFSQAPPIHSDSCFGSITKLMISLNCVLPQESELRALLERVGFDEHSDGILSVQQFMLVMDLWKGKQMISATGRCRDGASADLAAAVQGLLGRDSSNVHHPVELSQLGSLVGQFHIRLDDALGSSGSSPQPSETISMDELTSLFGDREAQLADEFCRMGATDPDSVCAVTVNSEDHYLGDHWRDALAISFNKFLQAVELPRDALLDLLRVICPNLLDGSDEQIFITFDDFRRIAAHVSSMQAAAKAAQAALATAVPVTEMSTRKRISVVSEASVSARANVVPALSVCLPGVSSSCARFTDDADYMQRRIDDIRPIPHRTITLNEPRKGRKEAAPTPFQTRPIVAPLRTQRSPRNAQAQHLLDSPICRNRRRASDEKAATAPDAVIERLAPDPPWRAAWAWESGLSPRPSPCVAGRNSLQGVACTLTSQSNGHNKDTVEVPLSAGDPERFHEECMNHYKREFEQWAGL